MPTPCDVLFDRRIDPNLFYSLYWMGYRLGHTRLPNVPTMIEPDELVMIELSGIVQVDRKGTSDSDYHIETICILPSLNRAFNLLRLPPPTPHHAWALVPAMWTITVAPTAIQNFGDAINNACWAVDQFRTDVVARQTELAESFPIYVVTSVRHTNSQLSRITYNIHALGSMRQVDVLV